MVTVQEFSRFELRVGTVTAARVHPSARKPSIQLQIDFGEAGVKNSSAQVTSRYAPDQLVGRQVVAVLNFPPRRIGDFTSEVLVLGAMLGDADVVLLRPDQPVPKGSPIA
jgi:tRNA-binding protein